MIKTKQIRVKNVKIGGNNPLVLIAGPCVIEDEKSTFEIAKSIKEISSEFNIPFIFKASFDKANRSSVKSDRKSTRLNSSHIPLSRMPSSA